EATAHVPARGVSRPPRSTLRESPKRVCVGETRRLVHHALRNDVLASVDNTGGLVLSSASGETAACESRFDKDRGVRDLEARFTGCLASPRHVLDLCLHRKCDFRDGVAPTVSG